MISRTTLLKSGGAFSLLAAAGCGAGATLSPRPSVPNFAPSLADLMKETGVLSARWQGVQYNSDGTTTKLPSNVPYEECPQAVRPGVAPVRFDNNGSGCGTDSNSSATYEYIGGVTYTYSSLNTQPATWSGGFTNLFGMSATQGPTYSFKWTDPVCKVGIGGAISTATGLAGMILKNPSLYAGGVVAAAAGISSGISWVAAIEFIVGLAAALTVPEFLILLAAIGATITAIAALAYCYSQSNG